MTVRAAHAEGKWVGVCGELAADPLALPLLVGLGVDELSVSARSIALVEAGVRELQLVAARGLARKALGLASAAEVRAWWKRRCSNGADPDDYLNPALDLTVRLRQLELGAVNRSEAVLTQAAGRV